MRQNAIYTISSLNYLHYALTVRDSFLKHNDNYDFIIFIADEISNQDIMKYLENLICQGVDIRFFKEIENELPDAPLNDMCARYNILEFNTAIKPYCMKYLFKKGYNKVIYIDPDIKFYSPIEKLDNLLDTWDVVLTPHMVEPYPNDGKEQKLQTIMHAGICNCGFIAVKNTENGNRLAEFWMEQLYDKCYARPKDALFTDQRWSDWFPCLFDKVYIFKNRGYNAAYWNLHERVITNRDGVWYANDDELVFYHFSGLNRKDMDKISKYQSRFKLSDRKEDLKQLFIEYLDDVNSRNADVLAACEYHFNYIPGTNVKIKDGYREIFYNKLKKEKISLYNADGKTIKKKLSIFNGKLLVKKHKIRHAFWWLINQFYIPKPKQNLGINVIGYIDEMHSIGEVARATVKKLKQCGIPFSIYKIESGAKKIPDAEMVEFQEYIVEEPIYDTNLFFVNADQIPVIYKHNEKLFKNKYNAANWYWEFESGFDRYSDAFKYLDEVIVSTEHIKRGLEKSAPEGFKITKIPYAFSKNWDELESREIVRSKYGIDKDAFAVFFNFDYNSSYDRKNPEAVLRAFEKAFKDNKDAVLVLKTTNADNHNKNKQQFMNLVNELGMQEHVVIIDKFLSRNEFISLMNACDTYISLHRGEGLGMGCIEAMALHKPVIATNYSGNLEFMNKENSLLVDAAMIKPDTDFDAYRDVEYWAEPDLDMAAGYLRELYENPEKAKQYGKCAKVSIETQFSFKNFACNLYNFLGLEID